MGQLADLLSGEGMVGAAKARARYDAVIDEALEHLKAQTADLQRIAQNVAVEEAKSIFRRGRLTIQTDATGVGETAFHNKAGTHIKLLKFSAVAPVGANGVYLFYMVSSAQPWNLVHIAPGTQYTGQDFSGGDYIPGNAPLICRVENMPANSQVYVNISYEDLNETPDRIRVGKTSQGAI